MGASFKNFRCELGEKLIKLNGIKDNECLKQELDAVSYEINETYINDIAKEVYMSPLYLQKCFCQCS